MKARNFVIFSVTAGLVMTGCKKDDPSELDKFNSQYSQFSTESVEKNKENLENESVKFADEINELKKLTAVEIMVDFAGKADSLNEETVVVTQSLQMLSMFKKEGTTEKDVFSQLKSAMVENPTLSEEWKNSVGKYSWDFAKKDWVETPLEDAIVFEFPGKAGDTENNATIRVDNFGFKKLTNPRKEVETDELPTSLNVSLHYNNVNLASFSFSAAYLDDGLPTELVSTLTVDAFVLKAEFKHTAYTSMSTTYSFKKSDKIMVETSMGMSGQWSDEKIKEFERKFDEEQDPTIMGEILSSANASMQVMNVKMAGLVNFNAILNETKALQGSEITAKEANTKMLEILNRHVSLVVVYADNNKKIAEAEFYLDEDEWGHSEPDIRFVFADKSVSDIDTYFNDSFTNFTKAIEDFAKEFENSSEPI